ncbi:MAG: hypothetical protein Q8O32_00470 [bacterium]|nr:hypothetical protein [bacterium]
MAKSRDKKILVILFVALGLACIASAFWFYKNFKPLEPITEVQEDVQYRRVLRLKSLALDNISDFLKVETLNPNSIWEDFYNNEQFNELENTDINIDFESNIGNPHPFATTSPEILSEE